MTSLETSHVPFPQVSQEAVQQLLADIPRMRKLGLSYAGVYDAKSGCTITCTVSSEGRAIRWSMTGPMPPAEGKHMLANLLQQAQAEKQRREGA